MKLPLEDGEKCEGVDPRCLAHQTGGDRQTEQPMSHRPAEWVVLGRRMIDMERIEISRESGEQDDIRFGHGSSRALPLIADDEDHRMTRLTTSGASRAAGSGVVVSLETKMSIELIGGERSTRSDGILSAARQQSRPFDRVRFA